MIQVQREIAAIQTTTLAVFNLQSMVERTAWEIRQYESQEATISYLKNLIEKLEKNPGTTLEKQHLWNWGRAAIYDRLATYQHETPAERKISLTRSREILLSSLPATRLFFHGASDHSTLPFSLITNLLKAGASDAPRKSNEEWTALMLELTPLLSEDEQKEISTLISDLLPATDPRFQSLKPLLKP